MLKIISNIITNVLTALYQPFRFAVILSVFFMFFWMYAKEHGWKDSVRRWIQNFKTSSYFRRLFLLVFYTALILFRTLLNRDMWMNPLSDVLGNWRLWKNGELITEPIENIILFIPFIVLLFWVIRNRENSSAGEKSKILKDMKLTTVLWQSVKITFLFSFAIEFLQLFLRLGTWQLSDVFYNVLGGLFGGLIYWICYRIKHRGQSRGTIGK